jgi:D-alanyl-D-alanine carboxypeptidase
MLPSGNDAALCLADVMGKYIQRYRKKEQKKNYVDTFLAHMNMFSKELKLPQEWRNPHGLAANPNYSTAQAITALTLLALQDNIFT